MTAIAQNLTVSNPATRAGDIIEPAQIAIEWATKSGAVKRAYTNAALRAEPAKIQDAADGMETLVGCLPINDAQQPRKSRQCVDLPLLK